MRFLHRLIARFKAWKARRSPRSISATFNFASHAAPIHREVTPNGVRVFSVCGACGARLQASATLCEECAQKRTKPVWPY